MLQYYSYKRGKLDKDKGQFTQNNHRNCTKITRDKTNMCLYFTVGSWEHVPVVVLTP